MPTQENRGVRPAPTETPGPKELLGRDRIGLQAALLLDGLMPQSGVSLELGLQAVKKTIDEGKHPTLTRTTQSSMAERGAHWDQDKYRTLTAEQKRAEWERSTNRILKTYADRHEEAGILKRIGVEVENGASGIYEEYFVREKGEIGYFAKKIAGTLSEEEIAKHAGFIQTLGNFYGKNSAEIARHLTEAVKNVRENYIEFENEASKQFSPGMDGLEVLKWIEERSLAWEEKRKMAEPDTMAQQAAHAPASAEPSAQPDIPEHSPQAERLVVQANKATEASTRFGVGAKPNEDDSFVDEQNGAFGVFDGLGSYNGSKEVAEDARSIMKKALASFRSDLSQVSDAEGEMSRIVKNVAEEVGRQKDARFHGMVDDVKKNVSGELTDEAFDKRYADPRRRQSWARWTKQQLDRDKADEINDELRDFITKRIEGATTAAVVKIWKGLQKDRFAIIANVGDSRVYHYSAKASKLELLTIDDTILNELAGRDLAKRIQEVEGTGGHRRDVLGKETRKLEQLNPLHRRAWEISELEKDYPWGPDGTVEVPLYLIHSSAMSQAVARGSVEPRVSSVAVKLKDRILIVSDGVYGSTKIENMTNVLADAANEDAGKAAQAIVQLANHQGFYDDTTAVVVNL